MLRKACVWRWSRYSWSSEPTFTLEINITGNPWTTPHRDLPLQPAYSLMRVSLRTRGCTESSCKQCSTVQHQQEAREHHFSLRKLVSHSWLSLLEPLHWKGSKEANAYRRNVIFIMNREIWPIFSDLTDFLAAPLSLQQLSRLAVRKKLGTTALSVIGQLDIPKLIISYLCYQWGSPGGAAGSKTDWSLTAQQRCYCVKYEKSWPKHNVIIFFFGLFKKNKNCTFFSF